MRMSGASILDRSNWGRAGVLALAVLALAGCFAEPREPDLDTNPPLYEIANSQGEIEGWMLGTIHALPNDVAWRTDAIERVINDADLLIVEVANLEDGQAIADVVAGLANSSNLPALPLRVPPSQRPALLEMIERSSVTVDQLANTETWAAALALAQIDAPGDPRNGVDRVVIREFDGREVLELEGVVAQLTIFDSLPEDDQRELLSGVLEESRSVRDNPNRLSQAWLKGDIATIERATNTGIMADSELREALLVGRNRRWTGKLAGLLRAEGKPLVAVGAAHLVGRDSVPAMLAERGYTVTPISR